MEQLVKKAQHGDTEAFIVLMEKNKETMKRVAFSYFRNPEDVADILQDTILDAFEKISTLRKAEYFKTWLVRILINNCNEVYRKNKRQMNLENSVKEYEAAELQGGLITAFGSELEFFDLLNMLPEDSRTIFQLYYGEQFTTAEIAQMLNMKESTVKSRIHRGKEQLRKEVN